MNIHVCGGRSSSGVLQNLFLFLLCFSLLSEVYTFTVEWSLVSPYQLSQSRNNWQTLQGGNSADIDFSKGGQIAFVPASPAYGYGLYNRGSPPVINLNLSKPKHKDGSSSEEHKHKRKHGDSSEEHSKHNPEHHEHHENHPEHHKSAKEELNEEHAEQAEVSAGIAEGLTKLNHFMKEQINKHVELRDQELNRGNEEAAKKEQAIIDLYQEQIKLISGVEKVQEAIMKGEIGMVYDNDGAGHGHHGHHGDGHHEGHGDNHGEHKHHGADQPRHHHDDDDDEEHGGYDDDDEGGDEGEYGHDEDDDDEGHGGGHHGHGDDDDEEGHHGGHGHDHEGGGHDHEGGDHGHGHEGGEHGHGHEGGEHGHGHEGGEHGHGHEGQGHHQGGDHDDDEFHDAADNFENDPDYDPGAKHKLDRRSPFVSSLLPSLSGTDTSLKTPDTATVDTTVNANVAADSAKIQTDTGVTVTPSDAPAATPYATDSTSPAATTTVSTNAPAAPTPVVLSPDANTNSGWFSWFGSSNTPVYSPYALLKYLSPSNKSADNLMSMFNVFSDPSNNSYLSNASTLMRIVMFFMPGTGIVDQVYFTMALSKIMWEAATMYYEGYGTVEIAVVVLGEMAEASYLSRRGEDSIISQKILTPGDTIKIDGMDVPAFLKYVKYMKYPDLTEAQEAKLQKDIDNLINITYPNISPELKTTFTSGLKDTMRFLSLFNVSGDLDVKNVDVNFSEVYIKMHSAFDDSPLEKIKKSILSAIDAVKAQFN